MLDGKFVGNWTALVDPLTGEFIFEHDNGNWWHINLPGHGNVVRYTGMENYEYNPETEEWDTVKSAGLFYYDKEAVCAFLAPPP